MNEKALTDVTAKVTELRQKNYKIIKLWKEH
jgi:hypothetical protein